MDRAERSGGQVPGSSEHGRGHELVSRLTDTGTNPATATSVTVTGLSNGTAYTFAVRAVNTAGAGAASASATVTPADVKPGQPAKPTAEAAGDGGILIRWQAPENRGSAITQYSLEQRLAGGSTWVQVARANAGDREFLHRNRNGPGRHGL